MLRRHAILLLPALPHALPRASSTDSVRGRLSGPLALRTNDGANVRIQADAPCAAVLRDPRLKNDEFELAGYRRKADEFEILPIHLRGIYVWRGGRKLVVTYWCDICAIRAWTPGKCQCCQEETRLDPRDPALKDTDPSK